MKIMKNSILTWGHSFGLGMILAGTFWGLAATAQSQSVVSNVGNMAPPSSAIVPATATTSPELAQDYANYHNVLNQVTKISQFRDVSPQNWSYEALKNLVENYGCIVGYPDGTYRGDRALTRYEFAAGLNACLGQIEKRILEARGQGLAVQGGTNASVMTGVQPGEPLVTVFNRAFYNDTGRFYDITDLSGQANKIFGWRSWTGSYFDNQIANDGQTFEAVYDDALRQQTAGNRVRTRDLANPFSSTLQDNPSYLRLGNPSSQF